MIPVADYFGYAGTVIGSCLMMPQLYTSWKTKKMDEVSLLMLSMYFLNSTIWTIYGVLISSMPLIIANGIAGLVGITLVTMKFMYKKP